MAVKTTIKYGSTDVVELNATHTNATLMTGGSYCNDNINIILDTKSYNSEYTPRYQDYLCFTAVAANSTVYLTVYNGNLTSTKNLEYSTDKITWYSFSIKNQNSSSPTITLTNIGDKVWFRGSNEVLGEQWNYCKFIMSGSVRASGNLNTLLSYTQDILDLSNRPYVFHGLFAGLEGSANSALISAPYLPALTLGYHSYSMLFYHCSNLIEPPQLPALTLGQGCYGSMFQLCDNLVNPPELPAIELMDDCYSYMFASCPSLKIAPHLPATVAVTNCYNRMFYNCTTLNTPPNIYANNLTTSYLQGMFENCMSLQVWDTSGDDHDKQWIIPYTRKGTEGAAITDLFTGCPGTRSTNSPIFQDVQYTYYTQNIPV